MPEMLVKTVRDCAETWRIIPCLSKKKDPVDGPGMVPPSEGLAATRAGAGRRSPRTVCRKLSLSFSALFDKKSALDFIKSRIRKAESSRIGGHTNRVIQGARVKARRVGDAYDLIGRRKGNHLERAPPRAQVRAHTNGKNAKMLRPAAEEARGRHGKEGREELELCKKRILMGRKCKPLNPSGSLLYDENGVLVPELLP